MNNFTLREVENCLYIVRALLISVFFTFILAKRPCDDGTNLGRTFKITSFNFELIIYLTNIRTSTLTILLINSHNNTVQKD